MSHHEWIALVALYKRATVSKSLLSLFLKEQPWANRSWFLLYKKIDASDLLVNWISVFLSFSQFFTLFMLKSKLLPSLFKKEWPWANCSHPALQKERLWAICSCCSWQKSDGSNSLFFTSESLFCSQKTSNLLEKLMSKFPTLHFTRKCHRGNVR